HPESYCLTRVSDCPLDRVTQLGGHDLVGVDVENPLATRELERPSTLQAMTFVGEGMEGRSVAQRDLGSTIRAPTVDDDDLVRPRDAVEHLLQHPLRVQRDDQDADPGARLAAHPARASSSAVCMARLPSQKSLIWVRQEKPGATTRSSGEPRTAGKRTRSPAARETS